MVNALLTKPEEERWDEQVRDVQFAINNTRSQTTGRTPSQLLLGYSPRGGEDAPLRDEVMLVPKVIDDIILTRHQAAEKIGREQERQKKNYDLRRRPAQQYAVNDLVLVERQPATQGTSRKLQQPYRGPLIITKVLPNDRYIVKEMTGAKRGRRYEGVVAVDKMKRWVQPGELSDVTESDSGEDDVVLSDDIPDEED